MASYATYVAALIEDLTDFCVETMVVEEFTSPRLRIGDEAEASLGKSSGRFSGRSAVGSSGMPPADPEALMDAVQTHAMSAVGEASLGSAAGVHDFDPAAGGVVLRRYADLAEEFVRDPKQRRSLRPKGADGGGDPDPELMRRTRDALDLLSQVRAPDRAALVAKGAPGREVDHRLVRELTRYWETRDRTVWCRTTMRLDGDAATQFRFTGTEAVGVNAAHRAMTMVAADQWQLLIVTFGTLLGALGGLRGTVRALVSLRWRDLAQGMSLIPPVPGAPMGFGRLVRRLIQLYSVGRVVFESSASSGVAVRTMVLASGDVETTIRRGVPASVLVSHTQRVTKWLGDLHAGVRWWAQLVPALVRWFGVVLVIGGGGAFVTDGPSVRTFAPLVLAVLLQVAVFAGRLMLRWKVRQVAGHLRGEVEVFAT